MYDSMLCGVCRTHANDLLLCSEIMFSCYRTKVAFINNIRPPYGTIIAVVNMFSYQRAIIVVLNNVPICRTHYRACYLTRL